MSKYVPESAVSPDIVIKGGDNNTIVDVSLGLFESTKSGEKKTAHDRICFHTVKSRYPSSVHLTVEPTLKTTCFELQSA